MDSEKKFYLLAEISGWNCTPYIQGYTASLKNREAYRILSYNLPEARLHRSRKAKALVYAAENLNFDGKSVQDAVKIETALNYLALHSYPEYYLNPLAIAPDYHGEIHSIGQLRIAYSGKEATVNEMILDEAVSASAKKSAVDEALERDLADMESLVFESVRKVAPKLRKDPKARKEKAWDLLDFLHALVLLFFLFFSAFYPYEGFYEILFSLPPGKALTYAAILFPTVSYAYLLSALLYHCYRDRVLMPTLYARRFLRRNEGSLRASLKRGKERLYDYVAGAINEKLTLSDDITDFSLLSTSYLDFERVLGNEKEKTKKLYTSLEAACHSLFFLSLLVLLFFLVVYFLSFAFQTIL